MTDVTRYWIEDDRKIEDAGETTRRDLLARLSRDRARAFVRVVLSDDYDALRAEVERLQRKVRDCAIRHSGNPLGEHIHGECDRVIERLTQELAASQAILSRLDQELAAKHPVYTLGVLQHIKGVS